MSDMPKTIEVGGMHIEINPIPHCYHPPGFDYPSIVDLGQKCCWCEQVRIQKWTPRPHGPHVKAINFSQIIHEASYEYPDGEKDCVEREG